MKQLISIATIQELIEVKQTVCLVEDRAIITPAAIDLATENGIKIVKEPKKVGLQNSSEVLDSLKFLLNDRDFIQNMINNLAEPYRYEMDGFNAKLIYGDSIQLFPKGSWKKQTSFFQYF
ncbi:hypothetical protein ACQKTA_01890 [Enterococcus sp. 22-H-5-01]|uniref:hypothetical protein n=1 Tax=Enterococcus sp. 22-H-5-01 TaxID=3418555 RepID=UPI003D089C2B